MGKGEHKCFGNIYCSIFIYSNQENVIVMINFYECFPYHAGHNGKDFA